MRLHGAGRIEEGQKANPIMEEEELGALSLPFDSSPHCPASGGLGSSCTGKHLEQVQFGCAGQQR